MSRSRHYSSLLRDAAIFLPDGVDRLTRSLAEDQERFERVAPLRPIAPEVGPGRTCAANVPIFFPTPSAFVVIPSTEDEMRNVLDRLPEGALEGLSYIRATDPRRELETSKDFREKNETEFPGIYVTPTLGTYAPFETRVEVSGYLYDRPGRLLKREYRALRRRFFETLLHEVAHHFDYMSRARGARRLMPGERRAESFAEKTAAAWAEQALDEAFVATLDSAEGRYDLADPSRADAVALYEKAAEAAETATTMPNRGCISLLVDAAEDPAEGIEILVATMDAYQEAIRAAPDAKTDRRAAAALFRSVAATL